MTAFRGDPHCANCLKLREQITELEARLEKQTAPPPIEERRDGDVWAVRQRVFGIFSKTHYYVKWGDVYVFEGYAPATWGGSVRLYRNIRTGNSADDATRPRCQDLHEAYEARKSMEKHRRLAGVPDTSDERTTKCP